MRRRPDCGCWRSPSICRWRCAVGRRAGGGRPANAAGVKRRWPGLPWRLAWRWQVGGCTRRCSVPTSSPWRVGSTAPTRSTTCFPAPSQLAIPPPVWSPRCGAGRSRARRRSPRDRSAARDWTATDLPGWEWPWSCWDCWQRLLSSAATLRFNRPRRTRRQARRRLPRRRSMPCARLAPNWRRRWTPMPRRGPPGWTNWPGPWLTSGNPQCRPRPGRRRCRRRGRRIERTRTTPQPHAARRARQLAIRT